MSQARDPAAVGRPPAAMAGAAGPLRLAAVGDLLLAHDPAGPMPNPAGMLEGVRAVLAGCDVVFGNLECTLPGDGPTVPTEPRVIAAAGHVAAVAAAGFNVVTLANNHVFDCFQAGFHRLGELLGRLDVAWFGAGDDLAAACAPAVLEVRGLRLAFLAGVDAASGPHQFAGPGRCGVAPLDVESLAGRIAELRRRVHHVIVSLHWGEERFRIPSPEQVRQARRLAEAGASLVLGHHPHVLQGLETWRGVPIIYSLGNFVACEVPYTNGDRLTWNREERTGCILLAELTAERVVSVRQVATYDGGEGVRLDVSGYGRRRIAQANRAVAGGASPGRYRRERLRVKAVRPVLDHLRWSELVKLRPGRFLKAWRTIGAGLGPTKGN